MLKLTPWLPHVLPQWGNKLNKSINEPKPGSFDASLLTGKCLSPFKLLYLKTTDWVAYRNVFSRFWRLASPRSGHQHDCMRGRFLVYAFSWRLDLVEGAGDLCEVSSKTALIPFVRAYGLRTSQRPPPNTIICRELGFQLMNFGGYTNIQTIAGSICPEVFWKDVVLV